MINPDPDKVSRRDALKTTGAILPVSLLASTLLKNASAEEPQLPLPTRILGRTGEHLSLLTLGSAHLRKSFMTIPEAAEIVGRALELGVNSIDTAPNYDESEDYLGEILKDHRDKVFLATKNEEPTYDKSLELIQTSLKRLKTDHIDLIYIHNFGLEERFTDAKQVLGPRGILGALREAKKQGMIRYIGVSGHLYPSRWNLLREIEDIDVYLCAVNFVARHQYNFEEKVFDFSREKNLGMIAMKVLGGTTDWRKGTPRFSGDQLEISIRYALSLPGVCSANIGIRKIQELEELAHCIRNFKPLTDEEKLTLDKKGKEISVNSNPLYGVPMT